MTSIITVSVGESIQEALNLTLNKNCREPTIIRIPPGVYEESIVIESFVTVQALGASIHGMVTCKGRHAASLVGMEIVNTDGYALQIIDDCDVCVRGCSITSEYEVVHINSSSPTITECGIHDGKFTGITVHNNSQVTIDNCVIDGNHGGIAVIESTADIYKNTITCWHAMYSCIYLCSAKGGYIHENILTTKSPDAYGIEHDPYYEESTTYIHANNRYNVKKDHEIKQLVNNHVLCN